MCVGCRDASVCEANDYVCVSVTETPAFVKPMTVCVCVRYRDASVCEANDYVCVSVTETPAFVKPMTMCVCPLQRRQRL